MRPTHKLHGVTVKTKSGVGPSTFGEDMSNQDFIIDDWAENIFEESWLDARNPTTFEAAFRLSLYGQNNNVNPLSEDVIYGKIRDSHGTHLGHLFHVNELVLPE